MKNIQNLKIVFFFFFSFTMKHATRDEFDFYFAIRHYDSHRGTYVHCFEKCALTKVLM